MSDTSETSEPMLVDTRPVLPAAQASPQEAEMVSVEEPAAAQDALQDFHDHQEVDPDAPKIATLGGKEYPCVDQVAAFLLADLVDQKASLLSGDDQTTFREKVEAAAGVLEYFLLSDSDIEEVTARLSSKTDPIGFPEMMSEMSRLLPLYIGQQLGKA